MSNQTYAPAPPESPLEGDLAETDRNRRLVLALGGVVGAIVLVVGGYLLLSGGGSTPAPPLVIHRGVPRLVAPVTPPTAAPLTRVPAPFAQAIGRDPFKPLYVVPAGPAAGPGSTGVAGTPTGSGAGAPTGTGTTVTPTGAPAAGGSAGSTGAGGSTAGRTYPLQLVRVDRNATGPSTATFLVNGSQTVQATLGSATKPGTIFGLHKELQLVGLTELDAGRWSARISVGESRTDAQQGVTIYVV